MPLQPLLFYVTVAETTEVDNGVPVVFSSRMVRLTMFAPPPVALFTIPFIYNIIYQHPALLRLIHRRDKAVQRFKGVAYRRRMQPPQVDDHDGEEGSSAAHGRGDSAGGSEDEDANDEDGDDGGDDDDGGDSEVSGSDSFSGDSDANTDDELQFSDDGEGDDSDEEEHDEADGGSAEDPASDQERVRAGSAVAGRASKKLKAAAADVSAPVAAPALAPPSVVRPSPGQPLVPVTDGVDVFDAATNDPKACRALESSLWELTALQQHHNPVVASLAAMFSSKLTKQRRAIDVRGTPLPRSPCPVLCRPFPFCVPPPPLVLPFACREHPTGPLSLVLGQSCLELAAVSAVQDAGPGGCVACVWGGE